MGKISHVVDSVRITAFTEPEAREVAEVVDQARNGEVPSRTLSFPEVEWARDQLELMKAGKKSGLDAAVGKDQRAEFERKFSRVEAAYKDGTGFLGLVRAPPLRLAGVVYDNVFALPDDTQLEPMLELARKSRFDLIVVKDANDKCYLAVNESGKLNRVEKNAEAILAADDYQHVRVVYVDDVVNSFFEGAMSMPRKLGELMENTFRNSLDSSLEREASKAVREGVDRVNNPEMAKADKPVTPRLATAGAIGLGTVGLSTFVAVMPEVSAGLAGLAMVGTVYNALRGGLSKADPYFLLNVMGVQLAQAKRTKIKDLE